MRFGIYLLFANVLTCYSFTLNQFREISHHVRPDNQPPDSRRYIVDIDGTICTKTDSDYTKCTPLYANIDIFNNLYAIGHEIHYWTARGAISGKNWDELTLSQLKSWGVKYNSINMGKPHYDVWIDDKAVNAHTFCDY